MLQLPAYGMSVEGSERFMKFKDRPGRPGGDYARWRPSTRPASYGRVRALDGLMALASLDQPIIALATKPEPKVMLLSELARLMTEFDRQTMLAAAERLGDDRTVALDAQRR